MRKIYPLLAVLTVSSWAHAQDYSFLPEAKLADHKASTWNVGAGFTQKLLHLNGEWVNPYGIAYAKVGAFLNGDKTAEGQVGFRYPYYLTGTDKMVTILAFTLDILIANRLMEIIISFRCWC